MILLRKTTLEIPDVVDSRIHVAAQSSLRVGEGMGGELEIVARFPDGAVRITQFQDIGPSR